MTERGHPYAQYGLSRLHGSTFAELWQQIGDAIKKAEYENEVGVMKATVNDMEIRVDEKETVGKNITEVFKPGFALDSVKSINYFNTTEEEDEGKTQFNHTFIAVYRSGKWRLIIDFVGELKGIFPVNGNYLLASEYKLSGAALGNVGFENMLVWSPRDKKVLSRQRLGYSGVNPMGYPIFNRLEDGSFIASAACTFSEEGGTPTLQIFETYNQAMKGSPVKEKAFYITRYFTYNTSKYKFEESKQEVIYRGE
jgi:hypothetical protein